MDIHNIPMVRPKKKICLFRVTRPYLEKPADPTIFFTVPEKKSFRVVFGTDQGF